MASPLPPPRPSLLKPIPEKEPEEEPTPPKRTPPEAVSLNKCRPFSRERKSKSFSPKEEEWKLAAAHLSRKLAMAIRGREEAIAEASRLRTSIAELEKKLSRLEREGSFPLKLFLRAVADSRAAMRVLRLSLSSRKLQDGLQLEGLLSKAFYEDFETVGFKRGGGDGILDPQRRLEANLEAYETLKEVSWEDVLSKGTRHYSEGFSKFCDRKMGEVAGRIIGGRRSWPESLLRAFFGAAKAVWMVHLLAWCGHPHVGIFRVEKGAPFDGEFMEEMGGDEREMVGMMMAPGFYLNRGVVKCRVVCCSSDDGRRMINDLSMGQEDSASRARRR